MDQSFEYFTPKSTTAHELRVNMERYMFALPHLEGKTVLDLGSGSGLGTFLYSTVAAKVIAVDYNAKALEEARSWPFPKENVEFLHLDLEDPDVPGKLPKTDVCVAIEVLEHLEEPALLLRELKAHKLIFGLPLYSLEVSKWHKYKIETERHVRELIQPWYDITKCIEQPNPGATAGWIIGEGIKYEGN